MTVNHVVDMCYNIFTVEVRFLPPEPINTYMERTKEEILKQINQVVDGYIQPAVQQHGGYIKVEDFDMESGRVNVLLQGSCSGCASSTETLKLGVENPYNKAEPVIEAIQSLIEIAPLSLEALPEIENPFRTDETVVNLDAIENLNNLGASVSGADIMAGVGLQNTNINGSPNTIPFENQTQDQKIELKESLIV